MKNDWKQQHQPYVLAQVRKGDLEMTDTTKTPVRWDTYVRAQSDTMFKSYVKDGAFGKFFHIRQPTPIDQQNVIRMNRDTLYSIGLFDPHGLLRMSISVRRRVHRPAPCVGFPRCRVHD